MPGQCKPDICNKSSVSSGKTVVKPASVGEHLNNLGQSRRALKDVEMLLASGLLERDLSRVTVAKIGGTSDPYYSHENLLARLVGYRKKFNGAISHSRASQAAFRLDAAIVDLKTDVSNGSLRRQPFCVVLFGEPGVGKSTYAIQIASRLMRKNYEGFNSLDMVTLNETDEFQSEFRSSHKVVLFDDVSASKPDAPGTQNPWRKVIDFVNNVQKTALNPNCELKGKVYVKPDLVIITTNLDLGFGFGAVGHYMHCVEAIQRRCSRVIKIKDFYTSSFIDYDIRRRANNIALGDCILNNTRSTDYISRLDMLDTLEADFHAHMTEQTSFVNTFNDCFDDLKGLHLTWPRLEKDVKGNKKKTHFRL